MGIFQMELFKYNSHSRNIPKWKNQRYPERISVYQPTINENKNKIFLFISKMSRHHCFISYYPFRLAQAMVCGVSTEGQGQWAKLCCRLISDSIFRLFYFSSTLTGRCNVLPKKVPKELYKKQKQNTTTDKRRRRFFDI